MSYPAQAERLVNRITLWKLTEMNRKILSVQRLIWLMMSKDIPTNPKGRLSPYKSIYPLLTNLIILEWEMLKYTNDKNKNDQNLSFNSNTVRCLKSNIYLLYRNYINLTFQIFFFFLIQNCNTQHPLCSWYKLEFLVKSYFNLMENITLSKLRNLV